MNRIFLLIFCFLFVNILPSQTPTAFELGLYAYDSEQYLEAIDFYTKHIKTHQNANTYFNRGLAYYKLDMNAEAIEDFTIVVNKDPTDFEAWHNRALAYYDQGDFKKAIFDAKKTNAINPDFEKAYNTIGLCYTALEKLPEAIENFTYAISLNKNNSYYYNRALAYEKMKAFDNAELDFTSAINKNPTVNYYWGRANLLYSKKEYALSLEDYGAAIGLDSTISSLYYNRGLSYYADYKDEWALYDFKKAIKIDPKHLDAKWYMALCYYELENYTEALKLYKEVEKENPNYQYFNQLDKDELIKKTKLGNNLFYIVSLVALTLLAIILFSKLFYKKVKTENEQV